MRYAVEFASVDAADFTAFLIDNGLGPIWYQALHSHGVQDCLPGVSLDSLRASRFAATALYFLQREALRQLDQVLGSSGIAYAAMKGAHVRELVYDDPSLRPAGDVDVLIPAPQRLAAARALMSAGFQYRPEPDTISHEATFTKGEIAVDLHWNILRPGRTRFDVTDSFIAGRRRIDGFWSLDDTAAIFLMLAQPPFAKYVCSPNMNLCQAADFILWLERRAVDWEAVAALLRDSGVKTAAWAMLRWFAMLGLETPESFMAEIQPGKLRRWYLNHWLEHNLPTRWFYRLPVLIQLGMTLFLHDRLSDAGRAMRGWLHAHRQRRRDPFVILQTLKP